MQPWGFPPWGEPIAGPSDSSLNVSAMERQTMRDLIGDAIGGVCVIGIPYMFVWIAYAFQA
jgi:hypothetical protein